MKWTSEPPKTNGNYWAYGLDSMWLLSIRVCHGEIKLCRDFDSELCLDKVSTISPADITDWYGPIDIPRPPNGKRHERKR
jgi:hypothetical protein